MTRMPVDLSSHLNLTVARGHPADFPVTLRPVSYPARGASWQTVPNRLAVVREDTGACLGVVSDRYAFVPHQRLLDTMERAVAGLEVGPVPRGIYVDRGGARMRALFKFPGLQQEIAAGDELCPCVKVVNTYDGTSRIAVSIGAFRFVCTNLAVGGGGVFASGFMAVHAGEIPVERVGQELRRFLEGFAAVVGLYRAWQDAEPAPGRLEHALGQLPDFHRKRIAGNLAAPRSVLCAYNAATTYATHETRSASIAFSLLERINRGFQEEFPISSDRPQAS